MSTTDLNNNILDHGQVGKAVNALFQFKEKQEKKAEILEDGEDIHLQMTFKLVPDIKNKIIKVPLPTSLMRKSSDVCLFVKDLDKKSRDFDPSIDHFKDLLSAKGVENISEVIPLRALKIEYQPYEAKRNLSNMYDFFLADERILRLLPNLLGKNFYARKRHPVPIDLQVTDLKHEVDRALSTARLIISGRGSSTQMPVAHTQMTEDQVVTNVLAAAQHLANKIPGGATNIKNIHLRLQDSPALPIYTSAGSNEEVTLPERKRKLDDEEPVEISTLMDKKIKITPVGEISFYSMDGEKLAETEKNEKEKPESKRRTRRSQGKITADKTKTNQLPPSKSRSQAKQTKADTPSVTKSVQKNRKTSKRVKSLEKRLAPKSGVKSKPKSKKMKT